MASVPMETAALESLAEDCLGVSASPSCVQERTHAHTQAHTYTHTICQSDRKDVKLWHY